MPKEYINPNSLFPSLPHGFSQVVVASGRKMVFISGQTAWDVRKNIVGGDSVLEQARQAFRNLETAMEAAGETVTGLLVDYHLDRGNGIAAIREIRRRFGENIPAILITADRSPHVRAAAREENVTVLNKPVKPASLRALLGQWRSQQMVAAE